MTLTSLLKRCAALLAIAMACGTALAQYPERPIRLVVPYPPGGGTDNMARLLADKLAQRLGKPFVVDNRAGANGNIGADAVAKAPADGYTLLLAGLGPLAVNPGLYARMPYDPARAFAPIAVVASAPLVLVAAFASTTLVGLSPSLYASSVRVMFVQDSLVVFLCALLFTRLSRGDRVCSLLGVLVLLGVYLL